MDLKCRVLSSEPAVATVNSARDFTAQLERNRKDPKLTSNSSGLQLTTSGGAQPQGQS